jgi:hypothetical protein
VNWLPAGLPAWFDAVARAIDKRFVRARPVDPLRLPEVANPDALPPAAEWRTGMMLVTDINGLGASCPVFSDGQAWRRFDTLGGV